jgi:nucleotidyltransferase AbiEii toxin of type IV toxin-antitoxin system
MIRLVRAAAKIADANLGRYAIIGGLAVSARIGLTHRATADIDAVVDDVTPPPAIEALLDIPGAQSDSTGEHRVVIDGIKVEIQATEPISARDLDGLTEKQILYVGAHRYALESATAITLVAEANQGRATVLMATPASLFAMKLHAIEDRRPSGGLDKRAGDAWDLYRILLDLDATGAVRSDLAAISSPLRDVIADAAEGILVERAARTVSWMHAGDERMAAVTTEELRELGQPVVDVLRVA